MGLTFDLCTYADVYAEDKGLLRVELYSGNITHNLTDMAEAGGLYKVLWCPDENGYKAAEDIIPALREGLARLKGSPDKYRQYNSSNGWGTYKNFVPFVAKVLDACEKYPKAIIEVNV